jgi:hypothetical protein
MIKVHRKVRGEFEQVEYTDLGDAVEACMSDLTHKTASPQTIEQDGKILFDQEALFSLWVDRNNPADVQG